MYQAWCGCSHFPRHVKGPCIDRTLVAEDYGVWLLNVKSVTQETLCSKTISIEILPQNLKGLFCNKRGKAYLLCMNSLSVLQVSFQELGKGRYCAYAGLPSRKTRMIIF